MKVIKFFPYYIGIIFLGYINSQLFIYDYSLGVDFQGIAIYQSKVTNENNFNTSKLSEQQIEMMPKQMISMIEKTYSLTFDNNHSIYKEQQKISQMQNQERLYLSALGSSNSIYFKNIKDKLYKHQIDFFGKTFLIQDSLKFINWTLTSESKKIGEYTCYKALATRAVDSADFSSYRLRNIKEEENVSKVKDSMTITVDKPLIKIPKTANVVAWYTPDIPISSGPGEYWGLPGLILEVSSGKTTILCSQIFLNVNDKIEIKEHKKSKKITQDEYNEVVKGKLKEIKTKFQNSQDEGYNFNRFIQ